MQSTPVPSAPRRYARAVAPADVLLADGSIATICPLGPQHLDGVRALHERVSPDNLRLRFMSAGARVTADRYVEHLRRAHDVLALVVLRDGVVVALGTAEPISDRAAEIAFLVDDGMHGLGIGTLLLEHLAAAARRRGLTEFSAEVLMDNHAMLKVLADAGFTERHTSANGCVEVVLDTALSAAAQAAADRREDQAESRSLRPLLRPRSVAVVGVRRDGTGIGAAVLSSIREGGFTGTVHVVHPVASLVCGVPASPGLAAIGHRVDLVVVAVPADQVLDVVAGAASAGARALVVLSSGFGEVGGTGGQRQAELLDLARTHGMRVVGPNCLGVLDNVPSVRLNATFSGIVPPPGGLAVASQSGGLGILLHELAAALGLGVAFSVSLGNKVDVSSNDLLSAWLIDAEVTAAALYLESFGNPRKFARIARRFSREKPLLAVVGGRSTGGRRAGASHTAAAATPAVAVDALFAQAGVIACEGPEDLAETALVLDRAALPAGRRLGIVVNAGGVGVVAADQAERQGLTVPALSPALQQELSRHVAGTSGTSNPVDAGAGACPDDVVALARRVATSGEVDAVLVALAPTRVADLTLAWEGLAALARDLRDVTLVATIPDDDRPTEAVAADLAVLSSTDGAVRALARAADYAAWRAEAEVDVPWVGGDSPSWVVAGAANAARELLAELDGDGGWLDLPQTRALLDGSALSPTGAVAVTADDAVRRAEEIGFPVAVKVVDPAVQHRTERGLVLVGLSSAADVAAAVAAFEEELGRAPRNVLVQPVVRGVELALGVVRDPSLGPLVMVAAGGIATELLDDRAFLLPPVTRRDALRALCSLRLWPLLDGYRGTPPLAADAVVDAVVQLARLAAEVPEVAELDVNPLVVTPSGCVPLDVKVRLAPAEPADAGVPRRLRDRS